MSFRAWLRPPRHLLAMFFGITLVSAGALGWFGWQLIEADRKLTGQRSQERLSDTADLAVSALQKHLSEVEERLTGLARSTEAEASRQAADYAHDLPSDAVLLVLHQDAMEAFPSGHLLYYPAATASDLSEDTFAETEASEARRNYEQAIALLQELSVSANLRIRAEALVRLARNYRNLGQPERAVGAYEQLITLGVVPVGPLREPAELAARSELCNMLAGQLGNKERVFREASTVYAGLQRGQWLVTRPVYSHRLAEVQQILGSDAASAPDTSAALSKDVYALWEQWQQGNLKSRQVLPSGGKSLLIVGTNEDRAVVLAAMPRFVESNWMSDTESTVEARGVRIALTNEAPRASVQQVVSSKHVSRDGSATGLPWTVSAISSGEGDIGHAAQQRRHQVQAAVLALALLVLGGSYLIGRAVARELAVARLQSDFVSAVSHEFRTPLTGLRQLSELLAKGRVPNEDVRQQYYLALEQESARLQRLVEGLLKFGRMEAGAVRYDFKTIDTPEFLRAVVAEFRREADRRGSRVELSIGDVRPTRADQEALSCAVWNLLDNAVKYSPDCRTVWVDLVPENGRVAIRVRDRGAGISRHDRVRIFQKFARGEAANVLGVEGTGIGLAMVCEIVARHGGEIKLDSEPGTGSTFTILLPAVES